MKLGLFFNNSNKCTGCHKVAVNLLSGLQELNIHVLENSLGDHNGVLQNTKALQEYKYPRNALIGPEIMVTPPEYHEMWKHYKYWCQPSQWVIDYMKEFPEVRHTKFYVWPVGIDTKSFVPIDNKKIFDVLVYFKDVTKQTSQADMMMIKQNLERRKLTYRLFKYGEYNEIEYKNVISRSRCAMFITGTESQGIAYMELMSCNLPIFVWEIDKFLYGKYQFKGKNVSAAPYFDERCGVIADKWQWGKFDEFIRNLDEYKPREYIVENHTLKKGAQKYIDILKDIK